MSDKQLTITTYAAGASLAAITLIYVFAPTFFLDGESSNSNSNSKKKTIVGLSNPANDCFINAVLQALAGLGELRVYLIRETHRRLLDGPSIYSHAIEDPARKGLPAWKLEGLQLGTVTQGLKEILNALNERPIYKKTISAGAFIKVLEESFRQKISLQQQDAQEFLQVVAERLCDEYYAGQRARNQAKIYNTKSSSNPETHQNSKKLDLENFVCEGQNVNPTEVGDSAVPTTREPETDVVISTSVIDDDLTSLPSDREEGFPLEGISESQIECLTCRFKPKPTKTTFCSITLTLPVVNSTTLNACFDQMFKTEYIDDFKCEKCRLVHALETLKDQVSRSSLQSFRARGENTMKLIQSAIENNPGADLSKIEMPDVKFAPKRKIARYFRITSFPKILAIHLSRSIFDAGHCTLKNPARVSFPELLRLGGLLNHSFYRLLSVVCHKGSHNSGHYESFRRQTIYPPFSTPNTFKPAKVYSKSSSNTGSVTLKTQNLVTISTDNHSTTCSQNESTSKYPSSASTPHSSSSTLDTNTYTSQSTSIGRTMAASITSKINEKSDVARLRSRARSKLSKVSSISQKISETNIGTRKLSINKNVRDRTKKGGDRWWRISDEKITESKTAEVLAMQQGVYLLFYELEKEN